MGSPKYRQMIHWWGGQNRPSQIIEFLITQNIIKNYYKLISFWILKLKTYGKVSLLLISNNFVLLLRVFRRNCDSGINPKLQLHFIDHKRISIFLVCHFLSSRLICLLTLLSGIYLMCLFFVYWQCHWK